jgi:MFS family permease
LQQEGSLTHVPDGYFAERRYFTRPRGQELPTLLCRYDGFGQRHLDADHSPVPGLTDSPLALSIVAALQFLPIMLLSLVGGAVADRIPRRHLMFWTQLLGALQTILLGTLTITGTVTIWHIYVLAITLGIVNALNIPLRLAFVSELVPRELLPIAVALTSSAQNLGRIVGRPSAASRLPPSASAHHFTSTQRVSPASSSHC